MTGPAWKQVGPSKFLRTNLSRRQIGKVEDLVGRYLFGDVFRLPGVADRSGLGSSLSIDLFYFGNGFYGFREKITGFDFTTIRAQHSPESLGGFRFNLIGRFF